MRSAMRRARKPVEYMRQATVNNAVTYLLDEEFFEELHRQLQGLIAAHPVVPQPAAAVANTYVRIGMWGVPP